MKLVNQEKISEHSNYNPENIIRWNFTVKPETRQNIKYT